MKSNAGWLLAGSLLFLAACEPGDGGPTPDGGTPTDGGNLPEVPRTYDFTGRHSEQSSVAYSGQVLRHVLIEDLKAEIGSLTARIDDGTLTPAAGDVVERLDFYYAFDAATGGDIQPQLATTPSPLQTSYAAVGSANLASKIAGNDDPQKQHKDWSTGLRGWAGASSPEGLVRSWFEAVDALAVARANGTIPTDPSGAPISKVYVTAEGQDYQQLIQKFLGGAVAFSQGADDYLDEGLSADHSQLESGKAYTALEHAWDEGFGYFGASRDYLERADAETAATPYADTNDDGMIDLHSEYTFGHAQNAVKRDQGSAEAAPTDFSGEAMRAFLSGRALLASTHEALSAEQREQLEAYRDAAVGAWEKAIASSVVHYINEVLTDMGRFGSAEYVFLDHAKHWSEMKGFALALQFNPRSPLTGAQFEALHQKLADKPALPGADDVEAYRTALREARALLGQAYGFDAANLGDDNGQGGW